LNHSEQVFTLLETIYAAFDEIARKRRVFKVETVGDCYVAVTGLPDPMNDHAVVMCRFARDCLNRLHSLTRSLEVTLGPDTAELALRVGIHSGPVTAGVLRGERSRFQLFGDTMNTASRMESTGERGRIHISKETAVLLEEAGKSSWFTSRDEVVVAKGKGELSTFWLTMTGSKLGMKKRSESESIETIDSEEGERLLSDKINRLVKWNVEVLRTLLCQIEARHTRGNDSQPGELKIAHMKGQTVLEEVKEIIHLPQFNSRPDGDIGDVALSDEVEVELHRYVCVFLHSRRLRGRILRFSPVRCFVRRYVASIASLYRGNHFHNFEHASHVAMSVSKLLSRIVAPDLEHFTDGTLHDHTYGITSDPLTHFACVFSALIHDVDHSGVPNGQLCKERPQLARFYKERSVAEQNSVDLSWQLLMDDDFINLRHAIYRTQEEQQRFRELIVNSVMATDIMDKDLKALRNTRWDKAFNESMVDATEASKDAVDRKATIVIEHLIQASDVSHTMQHWHIYRKWNTRLFGEMFQAFVEGRADKNPADFWYQGEIGFFDFYIIPLAKKLKDCGVFGVSSDEFLNYAVSNRQEWEKRGQEIVAEMLEHWKSAQSN
jgi:class 3 adenylate cyclase